MVRFIFLLLFCVLSVAVQAKPHFVDVALDSKGLEKKQPSFTEKNLLTNGEGGAHQGDKKSQTVSALASEPFIVFAPSSMSDVMVDIVKAFEEKTGQKVLLSLAGTSQLARQLEGGAPASYFITADKQWLDWALERDLLYQNTVQTLASNRLVLAVSAQAPDRADVFKLLTEESFAMAEPEGVPAGRYAKEVLNYCGLWKAGHKNAIFSENVRLTLRRLALGEVTSALVYQTDVMIEPQVKSVFVFPEHGHSPIRYWGAVTKHVSMLRKGTFGFFLQSKKAKALFKRHGFGAVEEVK